MGEIFLNYWFILENEIILFFTGSSFIEFEQYYSSFMKPYMDISISSSKIWNDILAEFGFIIKERNLYYIL